VGVAGTFAQFHKGHDDLLSTAFKLGEKVVIALTGDEMTKTKKYADKIPEFEKRKASLIEYLKSRDLLDRAEIIKLLDKYGTAITDENQDAIVVSEDTYPVTIEINNMRRERGLNPLYVISIPLIYSEENKPISSTKIREGIIDSKGKIINK
jgi:pantetheine-phosphate adenylyltransferase